MRLMSKASSITLSRWRAELRIIVKYLKALGLISPFIMSSIILNIGIIEFRGVRSSWATEEKNMAFIYCECNLASFMWVTSVQIAIIYLPLLITLVLTWMYFYDSFDLKILSLVITQLPSAGLVWMLIKYYHRLFTLGFSQVEDVVKVRLKLWFLTCSNFSPLITSTKVSILSLLILMDDLGFFGLGTRGSSTISS